MKFNTFEELVAHSQEFGISGEYFNWWNYSEREHYYYEIYYTCGHALRFVFNSKPQEDEAYEPVTIQHIYPRDSRKQYRK
jgi:hypothetical protein